MKKMTSPIWAAAAAVGILTWTGCQPATEETDDYESTPALTNAGTAATPGGALSQTNRMSPQSGNQSDTNRTARGALDAKARESSAGALAVTNAVARLNPTAQGRASGTVTFIPQEQGVRVVANLSGLPPGPHGFHIHEKGDCSAPDASSAGGHFNPTGAPHGAPGDDQHHLGDLGNIEADDMGRAEMDQVFPYLTLSGENSILGRGVIVHQGKDDLTSQPSGDAGARLACGIIQYQP